MCKINTEIECGLTLSVLLSTSPRHHSDENVVNSRGAFFYHNINVKENRLLISHKLSENDV